MKEAFYYMFKDDKFGKKALLYFVFVLIANLFTQIGTIYAPATKNAIAPIQYYVLTLLGFIALFIPTGYGLNCIKSLMEQNENTILPFFNIKSDAFLGFKCTLGIILLSVSFGLLYALCMIPIAILISVGFTTTAGVLVLAFLVISFLTIVIYSPAFCAILAKKGWITSFFRFIRATRLVKQAIGNYFKYTLMIVFLIILFAFINSIIIGLFSGGIKGAVIIALIISGISSYTMFLFAYLVAKSVKPECIE